MLVQKKALALSMCVAAIVFTTDAMQRAGICAQAGVSTTKQLEALLAERRDVLKQRLDAFESLEHFPQGSFESTIDARDDYLDAELELTSDKNKRVAILQQKLENAKKRETLIDTRAQGGQALKTDALKATARRLDVEIALVREMK